MAKKTVKIRSSRVRSRSTKPRAKIKSKFSSRKGYDIATKDLSAKQTKALLKQQGKYELARAKAGIISPEAMAHRERMARIHQGTVTRVNTVSQLTGSATALGGSAIASNAITTSSPSVQVNGGMTNATQGRPSKEDETNSQVSGGSTSTGSKPGKD